jgi:2-polyprenyl-3-methyl-5-hydroxy-6-metoxy-1,4-benzoquinol methylase
MDAPSQQLSWSAYYENASNTSWLDVIASAIYNERYLSQIIKTKPYSVLEVGTARGLHAITLSHFVPRVVGIDADEHLIKIAVCLNAKFKGKAHFLKMDAFNTSFARNSFDLCCSQGFFEHFSDSDILSLLEEQLRVAQIVIFSVPSYYYPKRNVGNERLMTLQQWEKLMDRFRVDAFYYGPNIDTSGGLVGSLKPNLIKKMLTTPRKAQICFTVRKR